MIRHIVWWELKDEADGRDAVENARRIKVAGEALNGKIPSLISLEISTAIQPGSTVKAALALMSTHNTMEDLKAYAAHPLHLEFLELVKACTASRSCLDYAI